MVVIGAFGKEASKFWPETCVADEGTLGIDVKFWPETVAFGFYVEAAYPHGVDEFD